MAHVDVEIAVKQLMGCAAGEGNGGVFNSVVFSIYFVCVRVFHSSPASCFVGINELNLKNNGIESEVGTTRGASAEPFPQKEVLRIYNGCAAG